MIYISGRLFRKRNPDLAYVTIGLSVQSERFEDGMLTAKAFHRAVSLFGFTFHTETISKDKTRGREYHPIEGSLEALRTELITFIRPFEPKVEPKVEPAQKAPWESTDGQ